MIPPFLPAAPTGPPVWPLPLVAVLSLLCAAGCLTLGLRDLIRSLGRKPSSEERNQAP